MSDCLVTKLKASVADASLPKLGVLDGILKSAVETPSGPTRNFFQIRGSSGHPVTLKVSGTGAYFTDSSGAANYGNTFVDDGTWTYLYISNVDCNIEVYDKYNIHAIKFDGSSRSIVTFSFVLEDLKYVENLVDISINANYSGFVNGDISSLSALVNLTRIELTWNPAITGELSNIGALTGLTYVHFGGTSVRGSIESFVQALRSNGKTSGSMTFSESNFITFNGVAAAKAGKTLSWNSTTITYDGETINA